MAHNRATSAATISFTGESGSLIEGPLVHRFRGGHQPAEYARRLTGRLQTERQEIKNEDFDSQS
jgi:hypothetical protein